MGIIRTYLRSMGDCGYIHTPYEKYTWTGRIKYQSKVEVGYKNPQKEIYLERYVNFLGLFPLKFWKVWENEENIIFMEEDVTIYECDNGT